MSVKELLEGLAVWLASQGFGVYRTSTPYTAADKAITIKRLPATPDWALAVNVYDVADEISLPTKRVRVQLRFRAPGIPTAVDEWADDVAAALHGLHHFTAGNVRIERAERINFAALGVDDNRREERTDNYELILQ